MKRVLLALCVCATYLLGQVVSTPTDVSGTGSAVAIAASGTAISVLIVAPSTNSSVVRCGDANISTTRGTPIAAGGALTYLPLASSAAGAPFLRWSLPNIFCLAQNGDKYSVALVQ